jgi:hypothetical protein
MDAAPDLIETPPREEITRRVAGLAMALGTFAVSIAWLRATPFDGDGGVVLAGALGLAAPRVLRATDTARGAVFAFWAGSIALGGAIGALVLVRAGTSLTAAGTFGLSLWVALASLRALGGIPLARLLHRGAPLDSLDAPAPRRPRRRGPRDGPREPLAARTAPRPRRVRAAPPLARTVARGRARPRAPARGDSRAPAAPRAEMVRRARHG